MSFHCAFTIRSDTRYLSVIREWMSAAFFVAGVGRLANGAKTACTLALIEAVDNAIFHAHRCRAAKPIKISIKINADTVIIEVGDTGKGIGRQAQARPEEMVDHGRGLFLIHKLMTKVESRMRDGFHILKMTYKI